MVGWLDGWMVEWGQSIPSLSWLFQVESRRGMDVLHNMSLGTSHQSRIDVSLGQGQHIPYRSGQVEVRS